METFLKGAVQSSCRPRVRFGLSGQHQRGPSAIVATGLVEMGDMAGSLRDKPLTAS